jgi:hypothetical protein
VYTSKSSSSYISSSSISGRGTHSSESCRRHCVRIRMPPSTDLPSGFTSSYHLSVPSSASSKVPTGSISEPNSWCGPYRCMRQHIRQHTAANVSIRQHSARQCGAGPCRCNGARESAATAATAPRVRQLLPLCKQHISIDAATAATAPLQQLQQRRESAATAPAPTLLHFPPYLTNISIHQHIHRLKSLKRQSQSHFFFPLKRPASCRGRFWRMSSARSSSVSICTFVPVKQVN